MAGRFRDSGSPAVAVLEHPIGLGIPLTAPLQAELMVGNDQVTPMPELLCEPGYRFDGAQLAGGGSAQVLSGKLNDIVRSVRSVRVRAKAPGRRVALLDTGLSSPNSQPMIDFTDSVRYGVRGPVPADDGHGHGSVMAQVIVAVNPAADIHPIRVLNHDNVGESYEVLTGLQYALYSGEFDCVSASLSSPVGSACDTSLGKSLDWVIAYCDRRTSTAIPIIAAAGNHSGKPSGYPAKLSRAVVVLAVDRDGNRASYNSQPPADAETMKAYGGDPNDTLGKIVRPDGTPELLYGTSLAAAAVVGAHLP